MAKDRIIQLTLALALTFALGACRDKGDKYAFQYVSFKQSLPYKQDNAHPSCNFDMHVLKAYGTDTVFAEAFNRDISEFLFGKNSPDVRSAMISFIDSIILLFKAENDEQVEFAKEGNYEARAIDYEYVINTNITYGNNRDIIGHFINSYQYTGGAHGGTLVTCRNYRLSDGSLVTKDNYFKPGYEKRLIPVLDSLLLIEAGCSSRDELDENGYFSNEPMFVPDNFEIRQDTIDFIFNQYDIAPYSTGITTLSVPEDIIRDIIR